MRQDSVLGRAHEDGLVGQASSDGVEALPERAPPHELTQDPGLSRAETLVRMRRLFAGIPTGIISNDLDTGKIEVNPAMERMLGYPAAEINPDNLRLWTHPDDRDTFVLRDEFDQGARESYDVEKRYIRADGETIWCRVVVEHVRDGDEPGRSAIAIFEDITERKLAELALRLQTDRLSQIVAIQQDVASADLDLQAVMTLICQRTEKLVGCNGVAVMIVEGDRLVFGADSGIISDSWASHEELKRHGLEIVGSLTGWALLHNESLLCNDMQSDIRANRVICERDSVRAMILVPLRHGETPIGVLQIVGTRTNMFVNDDLRTVELLSVVLSAAMSHASEFEAKRSQVDALARLRTIFEGASIGITHVDTEGRVLDANPAFEELIGYSTAELRELPPGKITHPDDWASHAVLHNELMAGTRDSYRYEKRYVRKDGELVWCQLTAVLERDPDGRPSVVTSMIEDISERKEAEDQLRQSQKMDAIGQLSAGIAHDFNNMLMGVLGYAEIARGEVEEGSRAENCLVKIEDSAQRAASLTRQLLAFGRRQTLQVRAIDLNELVSETVSLLSRVVGEQAELVSVLAPALMHVQADATQIQQVLFNLVLNARDAMPHGGTVTVETRNVELTGDDLTPHLELPAGEYVMLAVTDTGTGMSSDIKERLFEPFFTTKEVGDGTGLGLPSVYGIVKQSRGEIEVISEPGKGAAFRIYLPATDVSSEIEQEEPLPRRRRVL
ncbi:MAG: PAS domain S-box protein, partial [Gaiellaceae bacterium]